MKDQYFTFIYSPAAFWQVMLPAVKNSDYQIQLPGSIFQIKVPPLLLFENIEGVWYFCWDNQKNILQNNDFYKLLLKEGEVISMIISKAKSVFRPCRKFCLDPAMPVTIGSRAGNSICYQAFRLISAAHGALLWKEKEGYVIADESTNGIFINGNRINQRQRLTFGDCIDMFGLRIVFLGEAIALWEVTGSLTIDSQKLKPYLHNISELPVPVYESPTPALLLHRSPRKWQHLETGCVEIEAPVAGRGTHQRSLLLTLGPMVTMILPMLLLNLLGQRIYGENSSRNASFLYMGLIMAVSTALLGIFWALINFSFMEKEQKREEKQRQEAYRSYLGEIREVIAEKYQYNTQVLMERYPPAWQGGEAGEFFRMLWNRNPSQEDFLMQRIGIGSRLFQVEIKTPRLSLSLKKDRLGAEPEKVKQEFEWLRNVPVCVDLQPGRLLGIAGGREKKEAAAVLINLLVQIGRNNCYTDVKIALLYDENNIYMQKAADAAKWLPHIWSESRGTRYLAGNKEEAGEILYLLAEIARRRKEQEESVKSPHYIIFIENQRLLEGELIGRYLTEKESLGFTFIFIEECREDMPNECQYYIESHEDFQGIMNHGEAKEILFDSVLPELALGLARKMAGIRVREVLTGGELPTVVPFLELFGNASIEQLPIAEHWRKNRTNESLRVPIGVKAGGRPVFLDIHEKYHGPHGLVAGTTGSGKSEILQTYLLSLAMHFGPGDIVFFIIDYKGGGMGNLFKGLPHTIGVISNLSGSHIQRALISIKSENHRRELLFLKYGINHIDQFTVLHKNGEVTDNIPHLFIIVDEFAELKKEEPEFMQELVSVAQVGRSLGVHLILATQKPAGTVDDNIWSNSRFRLCLRVQDRQDSMDMLRKPDAAYITQAGRCYLQVGNDELYELFQSAWSGAAYEAGGSRRPGARMLTRTGKDALMGFQKVIAAGEPLRSSKKISQLEKLTGHLRRISEQMGYCQRMSLWLPPLPEILYWEDLLRPRETGLCAYPGLCDDPANQRQFPLEIDLTAGNVLVCGGPASGKSTFLQTFLYSLMLEYSPGQVQFYLIDCSSRVLLAFEDMPHTACAVCEDEEERIGRIFYRLGAELRERKEKFAGGSFHHREDNEIPAVCLVIDNYGSFKSYTREQYEEKVLLLAKEGGNYGIYLVLSAYGISIGEVAGKLAGNFTYRIALEMGDQYQYAELLKARCTPVVPNAGTKGRGICKPKEDLLEFQTALVLGAENDFSRNDGIRARAAEIAEKYGSLRAVPIPNLPDPLCYRSFLKEQRTGQMLAEKKELPIGYDKESGYVYGINLAETVCFLISGRAGSGKTNLLKGIAQTVSQINGKVIFIDFNRQPIKISAENIQYIHTDKQLYEWLAGLIAGIEPGESTGKATGRPTGKPTAKPVEDGLFILIDNLAVFLKKMHKPPEGIEPISGLLEILWRQGRGTDRYWFGAWNPEADTGTYSDGLYQSFTGCGKGLHLGGNTIIQRTFVFTDMNYTEQSKTIKPGCAYIPPEGEAGTKRVLIPLVQEEP